MQMCNKIHKIFLVGTYAKNYMGELEQMNMTSYNQNICQNLKLNGFINDILSGTKNA